ncbi:MAG: nucleotidyltransferase family protein [Mycobacteriales bacterium]
MSVHSSPLSMCAVILAAGEGKRLRPLTDRQPKPLLWVGDQTLLDRALANAAALGLNGAQQVAVNVHHLAEQIVSAVGSRAHILREPRLLGTAGTVAALAEWVDGRDLAIFNADAYRSDGSIAPLLAGWSGAHPRLLVIDDPARADFDGHWRFAGVSLLPNRYVVELVRALPRLSEGTTPGLYEHVWRPTHERGELELVPYPGIFIDCGTPADYAAAQCHAAQ